MKKISTLFVVTYENNKPTITNTVRSENSWVFERGVLTTVKFDGTAAMVEYGTLYKRYDAKKGKTPPKGSIPCQPEPDPVTGHWPHWVRCEENNPADKYFLEAFDCTLPDGTYELCGPKVGVNAENLSTHKLLKHGSELANVRFTKDNAFEVLRTYLKDSTNNIEGLVFHYADGSKCKIRKTDFGFKR